MAHKEEIDFRRDVQESTIERFRRYYYTLDDTTEIACRALVSRHDTSIRFTNSTTSVMKPFLEGTKNLDTITYLAQPAMGQQGLFYWQRDHVFGPYASYFASLGALYPAQYGGEQALVDINAIIKTWGVNEDELTFAVHESDEDLVQLIERAGINPDIQFKKDDFRHKYGLEDVIGRNINIEMHDVDNIRRTLGNLTLIHTSEKQPIGYEVSFDSTTATSLTRQLAHPVFAHYKISSDTSSDESRAIVDTLSTSSALLVEGVVPVSRGRSGILRKFLLEYMRLARNIENLNNDELRQTLECAANEEVLFRQSLSPELRSSASYHIAKETIGAWLGPLTGYLDKEELRIV